MFEEQVESGIEWLDNNTDFDWRKEIVFRKLNMDSHTYCILGQVFGHFEDACKIAGFKDFDFERWQWAKDHGFMCDRNMDSLAKQWKLALSSKENKND